MEVCAEAPAEQIESPVSRERKQALLVQVPQLWASRIIMNHVC